MIRNNIIIAVICLLSIINFKGAFSQTQFRETVWIQSNRDIYIAGENINYKVVLLEADTYQPSVLSKNVRIELVDENGNKIIRQNNELKNSRMGGIITLPDNLSTGWYYIKAYSNWMRNFADSNFTTLPIRILNPGVENPDSIFYTDNKLKIKVFPQNGKAGYENNECTVFVSNSYNEGVAAHGFILSSLNDTVLHFNTGHTGWATSFYNAAREDRYQAFAKNYRKDSISIEIINKTPVRETVNVSTMQENGYLNIYLEDINSSLPYKLLIHRLYSWSKFQVAAPENNKITFRIPVEDLPAGISQLVILDNNNKLIFKQLWSDYNEESSKIRIETDTNNLTINNEYEFRFYTSENFKKTQSTVLNLITDKYIKGTRMYEYLPGLPGWYAKAEIPKKQNAFNGWLAANTYPNEISTSFFSANPDFPNDPDFKHAEHKSLKFYPETKGGTLNGKISDKNSGNPIILGNIALTILNDNSFFATRTDNHGNFVFSFPGQYGTVDYLLNYFYEYNPTWELEIFPDYATDTARYTKKRVSFTPEEIDFLMAQSLNLQLKKIYFPDTINHINNGIDSIPKHGIFYGKPDISVKVDDYIKLPNLREVIAEVVTSVKARMKNKKFNIYVTGEYLYPSSYPTLVLFDGIPVYDYDELLSLPPERIETIDVLADFYIHGNVVFEGIVNIQSVNHDLGGLKIPQTTIISTLQLPNAYKHQPLRAIKPETDNHPSIDDILLWESVNNTTVGRDSFFTNSNPGRYILSVYGFDNNGKWHCGMKTFNAYEPTGN